MAAAGSRRVAGWVAGYRGEIRPTHAVLAGTGSRCSTFFNELRIHERKVRRRIGLTIGTTCYTCYPGDLAAALEVLDPERWEAA